MTDVTMEKINPPKRRWFRLSLRVLMLGMVIFACVLEWVVKRASVQREAVAAIEKTGGKVHYEWQRIPGKGLNPQGQPIWPKWLVERLGVDYFGSVVLVNLGRSATDEVMVHVGRLSRLEGFSHGNAREITDVGAAQLAGLVHLDHVDLSNTKVTGKALAYFRGMNKLKGLHLIGLPITDADLENIAGLTALETLDLNDTKATDNGLAHLARLVNLRQLRLRSLEITGPGLAHLQGMTQLRWLMLGRSKVHDLSSLPSLPTLQTLLLDETLVNDDGLAQLPELPSIQTLSLTKTAVTDAGLPNLLKFKGTLAALRLGGPGLTDAALPTLLKLEKLSFLSLVHSKVTDTTLDGLASLKGLRTLDLDGSASTKAGLSRLKKAIPEIKTSQEAISASQARSAARVQAVSKTPSKNSGTPP
jgi:hypothetical protein